jgi:hypothetical protein
LGILLDGLDFDHLLVGFGGLGFDVLLDDVGLLFVDGEAFEELVGFGGLLLKLGLEFGHLDLEFGDYLVCGV